MQYINKMKKVFIIAEAGVNHNGSLEIAKKLIDVAAEAGVDVVKFQTFKTENLVSTEAPMAEYQKNNTSADGSQFEMIKKLELDEETHIRLIDYCKKKGIGFLSTPFDHESIELLHNLEIPLFKIPSGEVTNLPYLRHIGRMGKPIILSTGMSDMKDIEQALIVLTGAGAKRHDITILHCNTEYPTPMQDVNLKAMLSIKEKFGVKVGYSDHTLGIEIPVAAVALGAEVIEKHFTLDKNMEGPDHKASLDPNELNQMVKVIRNIEKALGDGVKKASESERKNIIIARKSIVAGRNICKGEILSDENLKVKRPGSGINPMMWDSIIGQKAKRDFLTDELIEI